MIGNPAYPTYQVFLSLGVSAIITLIGMPFFIRMMKKEGVGQQIRADGPQQHLKKQGTPTMGGTVMLLSSFSGQRAWYLTGDFVSRWFWY